MLWKGFQKPKRLATDTESLTDKYGHFWAQPFERGFGTTIGNALRRVLLSSIEGAAVTAVKIEGVLHEFQSIPGVVEDATDIILNLKQIPFRLNGDAPKAIYLRADQPGVVTSGNDRGRRRRRSARQGRLHRHHQRRRQARHGDAAEEGPRLRFGRQELRRGSRTRFHSDRLGALAGAQVQLLGRSRPSGTDHRLRQAGDRSVDQRLGDSGGRARTGGEAAEGPHEHLHQLRG